MNVHAHESQVFLTARHLDLLSNPAQVTVVNPENLLQVKNVVVAKAEDVDFSYVCLTGTKLRSLKLSAPLMVPPRPQTHDLLESVISSMGATLVRIEIHDLDSGTFHARLILDQDGRTFAVDSRPSDALALGVASDTPIFVEDSVIEEAGHVAPDEIGGTSDSPGFDEDLDEDDSEFQ